MPTHLHATLMNIKTPIYRDLINKDEVVAVFTSGMAYDSYMANLLPDGIEGVDLVIKNTCNQIYSYALSGDRASYLGAGDLHDRRYSSFEVSIPFGAYFDLEESKRKDPTQCFHTFNVYPNPLFVDKYSTELPAIFTSIVAGVFFLVALSFLVYDWMSQRRHRKVFDAAVRSNAIVTSLFPSNVRDQLYEENDTKKKKAMGTQAQLKSFLDNGDDGVDIDDDGIILKGRPLAELFPEATIMFADIAGFTAWSSVREPAQVFILLETLYHAFDQVARRRRVFKIETIGDCYVAVCGLPDPKKDHAVVMARFAQDCLDASRDLVKRLETTLGPDTGDLMLRVGLHSGPVTAGVLRGEKSRFQLFGDTMNTTSRIESTGQGDRIHISQETANLLVEAGKSEWISKREDVVMAKGKGVLQTFWLSVGTKKGSVFSSSQGTEHGEDNMAGHKETAIVIGNNGHDEVDRKAELLASGKASRLVDWNVDVLKRLLKQVIARRHTSSNRAAVLKSLYPDIGRESSGTVLDEVKEIVTLPDFDSKAAKQQEDPDSIEIHPVAVEQLKDYVTNVAALYNDNDFHNFEHASHVTMSVVKLMSRIVAPAAIVADMDDRGRSASMLHDHTYGITSDPLTQFACVYSALIHDVDHQGVPNAVLVKEGAQIAQFYQGKSVAEQNSVDLAWDLLHDSQYDELRAVIFPTEAEKRHFRQIVANVVMATDIMDKDLKTLRNARWDKAFKESSVTESATDQRNRKATIVIEHLIQASDVSHTMQHWHIYRKWNERFFLENYKAFKSGRIESNPTENWYRGEIGFFDFYILPLARKLKECGVFGVSSDEYLNYAQSNRNEWESRGEEVVASMLEKAKEMYG